MQYISGLHGFSHFLLNYFYMFPLPDLLPVRESLFNSTALYSSAAAIFGGLPGALCYVAIQPCSLDFQLQYAKKEFLESKMGERESKMGESEKQNR